MDLKTEIVKCKNSFSITTDKGDVEDIRYFSRKTGYTMPEIFNILFENGIPSILRQGVLLFKTERDAEKAAKLLPGKNTNLTLHRNKNILYK